jgi:hypothetical protein
MNLCIFPIITSLVCTLCLVHSMQSDNPLRLCVGCLPDAAAGQNALAELPVSPSQCKSNCELAGSGAPAQGAALAAAREACAAEHARAVARAVRARADRERAAAAPSKNPQLIHGPERYADPRRATFTDQRPSPNRRIGFGALRTRRRPPSALRRVPTSRPPSCPRASCPTASCMNPVIPTSPCTQRPGWAPL